MKRLFALFSLGSPLLFAAVAPVPARAPTPKTVVQIPPPSPDLGARCRKNDEWKRYGSVEACEAEKRADELVAFQQSRLHAERMAEQSDEKILKDLGFDVKSQVEKDTDHDEEDAIAAPSDATL